jgi:hypothetical protein
MFRRNIVFYVLLPVVFTCIVFFILFFINKRNKINENENNTQNTLTAEEKNSIVEDLKNKMKGESISLSEKKVIIKDLQKRSTSSTSLTVEEKNSIINSLNKNENN